jgi:broad specificity phosphatase PhoE
MPTLHLVRHGAASAGWDTDPDPGLSPHGHEQAAAMAAELAHLGPLPVYVSPLRRCRETAVPLLEKWGVEPVIEPRVSELRAPEGHDLQTRTVWLRGLMQGTWAEGAPELDPWRDDLVGCILAIPHDAVVVTHFIGINVVVGRATGDDRVVCRHVDNCSITVVDTDGGALRLLDAGSEADTEVL